MVNHRALTAAMIGSRDFLSAKRRAETEVMPPGPKVAFAGGYECNDHEAIWAALEVSIPSVSERTRAIPSPWVLRQGTARLLDRPRQPLALV